METKPLGKKNYGSIGHLPTSRLGEGDHHIHEGQAKAMLEKLPKGDKLIVQEKLDGSNVGVCKVEGKIIALGRAGWSASSSPYEQHQLFARWVRSWEDSFDLILGEGERCCGEWLAMAHGIRYELGGRKPFAMFDVFTADEVRLQHHQVEERAARIGLPTPKAYHVAEEACPIERHADAPSWYGAVGPKEGLVYRWERPKEGRVLMLAKWVRPDKVDGDLLPERSGQPAVWNWRPE